MNVFGDLARPITQRPGDPKDHMSYAEAMALRDRHRSGQPVDKDKLAEADRIVKATRAKVFAPSADEVQEVQEHQETAGDAGAPADEPVCTVHAAPGSMLEKVINESREMQQPKAQEQMAYPLYEPRAGAVPWKVYKYLKKYPGKTMTRNQIAEGFQCFAGTVDGQLDLGVARGAFVKKRNAKMEVIWGMGPSDNVLMKPWDGTWVDPDSPPPELVIPKFAGVVPPVAIPQAAPVLADASITEGMSTTSWVSSTVSTPASTPEESSSAAAAQPCADSPNSGASVAQPAHEAVALERPASEVSAALAQQQSEVADAPVRPEPEAAPLSEDDPEGIIGMACAVDPGVLVKRPDLWNDKRALEKRWVTFFDGFEVGDHVDMDEWAAPEIVAWRSFYEEKSWEYADGVRMFTIFQKDDRQGDGEYRMVRVL